MRGVSEILKPFVIALFTLLWLLALADKAESQPPIKVVIQHATDCTAATAKAGVICFENDANTIYVCEPSAGDCDTAGEWTPLAGDGAGDVVGPASSTDNALALWDDTTGELLQDSTVTWDGVSLNLPNTAGPELTFGGNMGGINQQSGNDLELCFEGITCAQSIEFNSSGAILNGTTDAYWLNTTSGANFYSPGSAEGQLRSGTTVAAVFTATEFGVNLIRDDDTQSETCADDGAGTPAAKTITPLKSYVEITNSDPHGCDVTVSETGAAAGRVVDLAVVSNAGGTVNFADTAGVTELAGAFNAAIDDYISLRYGTTTTWRERFRSDN